MPDIVPTPAPAAEFAGILNQVREHAPSLLPFAYGIALGAVTLHPNCTATARLLSLAFAAGRLHELDNAAALDLESMRTGGGA